MQEVVELEEFFSSYSLGQEQVGWHSPTVVVFHGASVGTSCLPGLCCRVGETSACHTSPPDVGSIASLFLFVLLVFVCLFACLPVCLFFWGNS